MESHVLIHWLRHQRNRTSFVKLQTCINAVDGGSFEREHIPQIQRHGDHQMHQYLDFHCSIRFVQASRDTHHQILELFWGQSASPSGTL